MVWPSLEHHYSAYHILRSHIKSQSISPRTSQMEKKVKWRYFVNSRKMIPILTVNAIYLVLWVYENLTSIRRASLLFLFHLYWGMIDNKLYILKMNNIIIWQRYTLQTYGRKLRGTQEPLDEGERGEWSVGLKLNIQKMKSMASGPIISWQIDGETMETVTTLFSWAPESLQVVTAAMKLKHLLLGRKANDKPRQHIKKQRHYFANKGLHSQRYDFSSSHVWLWELYHKEGWALKYGCFWTVVLEETLESPLDWKEIQPVNSKGNQSWIFTGRTDAEAEAPMLWPTDVRSQFIRKNPDAGKQWRKEKGTTEDEMVGWHHWLNGHEFEQAPGDGDGQGNLNNNILHKQVNLHIYCLI